MTEYITKHQARIAVDKRISELDYDPEFTYAKAICINGVKSHINAIPPADVIEREKIDKVIDEITKLRNSTDRMITRETTFVNECYKQYVNCFDECLEIIKRNIGE